MHRYDQRVDRRAIDRAANGEAAVPGKQTLVEASGQYAHAGAAVEAASNQSGEALPGHLQRKFETSLGADLSGVRIHRSAESATAAQAVSAKAYTLGNDIHFGAGHFDPSSPQGEHLLAHEVAHTVQQHGGIRRLQLKGLSVSQPGDSHEVEADSAADAMVAGKSATVSGAAAGIAREAAAKPLGPGSGPKLVMSGPSAIKAALVHLRASEGPVTVGGGAMGDVTLTPGAAVNDTILLQAGPMMCTYIIGSSLYEAYTPDFVRDIWLTALSKGAGQAAWLIPLAKAEFALITGLINPIEGAVVWGALKLLVFVHEHGREIKRAGRLFADLWRLWHRFTTVCPYTTSVIFDRLESFRALITNMKTFMHGIELEDVAYFIGRVLGVEGLAGKVESGVEITAKVLGEVLGEYAILVPLLHAPSIIPTGIEKVYGERAVELKKKLAEGGITVTIDEARKILHELNDHPETQVMLNEMKNALVPLAPAITKLVADYKAEMP